ncbi:MAG: Gldg family protein, partial [Clostridia bacterium]|nr:Gldg family protein [Clostridia bacterium]
MMPITTRDVILGKYFSALALVWLPNIAIALYSVIIGFFGIVDHTASYTALLGFALFEMALLAVYFFIVASARTRVKAYIICYLIAIVWYFLNFLSVLVPTTRIASLIGFSVVALLAGVISYLLIRKVIISLSVVAFLAAIIGVSFLFVPERFSGAFESFINYHSIFSHLYSFTGGIFNVKGIVFLLVLSCGSVFLSWRCYERKYEKSQTRSCLSLKKITSLGMASLIVCLSLTTIYVSAIVPNRFMTLDSTASHKYSVSTEARDFLSGLDKDVTLYLLEPTDNEGYELYLERLTSSSDKLTLKKVFYADDPMFYISRNISTSSISANSILVECDGSYNYLSYYNLFVYSNEKLGATEMSYSDYSYYLTVFSSSEEYYEYYYSLVYDTTVYFNADSMICSYIEYTAADIIPKSYYMTGHGELSLSEISNPYSELGLLELNITENDIPRDAASILINVPKADITAEEKQKLLEYLECGGQLTFITEQSNLKHVNLCSVLDEYGLSSSEDIVKDIVEPESGEETEIVERSAEFAPTLHTDNDVLYYLDGSNATPYATNATAIKTDNSAKDGLTIIPLLTSSSEAILGDSENT